MKKSIAVIGGGGAGLVCAWSLGHVHEVVLFEKEPVLGGHATTENVEVDGHQVYVDMGVEFFSEKQAPNLWLLLEKLQIPTYVAPLSFSACFDQEFWTNPGEGNLWPLIYEECSRFQIQVHDIMHGQYPQAKGQTLGAFLKQHQYSENFIEKALFPLLTTFSSCQSPLADYNLMFCALLFSMGFLSFFHPTYWRKVTSGIGSYIQALARDLQGEIRCDTPVTHLRRDGEKVTVFVKDHPPQHFDEVVLAVHADQALRLLESPSRQEQALLEGFSYTAIHSVLHTDNAVLGPFGTRRCYLEYKDAQKIPGRQLNGSLTRFLNALPRYTHIQTPILVTFDPKDSLNEACILKEYRWKIPLLRPQDLAKRKLLKEIQGCGHVWYCGTDTTFSGHEGAILSGLILADFLGAPYPFANHMWAKIQYDIVKGLMGLYKPFEKIGQGFTGIIHQSAKILGLHPSQMARMILELYV